MKYTRRNYSVKIVCFLLSLLAPVWVCAQLAAHTVRGTVADEQGEALAYATVALRETEGGKVLAGSVSDETGEFSIDVQQSDELYVEMSMVGYLTYGALVTLNPDGDTEIGKQVLSPDPNALEEVTVTAKHNRLTRKIDRLVVDVEDNAAFAGRSSLALFSSAPGVFVQNGQISINGMPGTKIMVNGRLLKLSGDDLQNYLENLKADDIKAIEIIAHPPAEYDAEGTGGIINIILKANQEFGLTGRIGANYGIGLGKYPNYRPNAALDYKKGKVTASASYSYSRGKDYEQIEQQRTLADGGNYWSDMEAIDTMENHSVRASMTYDINDRHFLGVDYSGQYGGFDTQSFSEATVAYPDIADNTYSVGNFPIWNRRGYSNVGLNYIWTTDTLGSKLSILGDYTYNKRNASSRTNSQTFAMDGKLLSDTAFTFYYPNTSNVYTAEAKYNQNFSSGVSLTFGGKISATDIANANHYDLVQEGELIPDVDAFNYDYRERIYAGFASLTGALWGVEYSVGLRGEQSDVHGDLNGTEQDTVTRSHYFNWFPNASLQKLLTEDGAHILTASYSKRISRPSFSDLNPYRYYIDNYSVSTGNAYLRPQFREAVELGYLFKQQYYVSLSYAYVRDVINLVTELDPASDMMTILKKNTGRNKVYTATVSVPVSIADWWTTTNNLLLTHSEVTAPEFSLKRASFVAQTEQSITLPNDWGMNLSAFYTPKVLTGNIVTGGVGSVDFGVRKTLLDKRLQLNANISDIFYSNNFDASNYYNNEVIRIHKREQSRVLSLSLLYNFNIGKAFQAKRLEKSNADEQGRL